jgi:hypothetical protein
MKVVAEAMEGAEEEAMEVVEVATEVEVEVATEVVQATLQSSSMMVEEGVEDMQGTCTAINLND